MINKILTSSYYLLFAVTPMLWAPWNFELFEFNKMMFVYLLTIIISAVWIFKMVDEKKLILKSTPLDLPLILFLIANILSTIFSIDKHVSIFGYYSRLNGGLLSTISYIILYYGLVSNFDKSHVFKFLKAGIFGGVIVALYAIPEHFGASPSCRILTQDFNASCWVQDVQARVFATLGQPNWLAGYLGMLIFPALYFAITAKNKLSLILYSLFTILFYTAFTFTYSRGATLGLIAGIGVFLFFYFFPYLNFTALKTQPQTFSLNNLKNNSFFIILASFVIITLLFGSALTGNFKLLQKFAPPARPSLTATLPSSGTQLENGGTESGKIRLIVWEGALNIFKAYPFFGSGVETYAYAYYQFRPVEHNLVSEWDFLYNKAHNEFLNYLATTGIIGFGTYLLLIFTFIFWSVKRIKLNSQSLIHTAILASYISYLVTNFFGFSVVITALFFFLFPALSFLETDSLFNFKLPKLLDFMKVSDKFTNLIKIIIILTAVIFVIILYRFYQADISFAQGNNASEADNPGRAYNRLLSAVSLNPLEPYYRSELAYSAAAASSALAEDDATTSARLKKEALAEISQVLKDNPKNTSYYRTNIRTLFMLATVDKTYLEPSLQAINDTIKLAPTDAKLSYNKAVILGQMNRNAEAIKILEETIKMKPDYRDAYYTLGLFLFDDGQKEKAILQMKKVLELDPNDTEVKAKLKEWQ